MDFAGEAARRVLDGYLKDMRNRARHYGLPFLLRESWLVMLADPKEFFCESSLRSAFGEKVARAFSAHAEMERQAGKTEMAAYRITAAYGNLDDGGDAVFIVAGFPSREDPPLKFAPCLIEKTGEADIFAMAHAKGPLDIAQTAVEMINDAVRQLVGEKYEDSRKEPKKKGKPRLYFTS